MYHEQNFTLLYLPMRSQYAWESINSFLSLQKFFMNIKWADDLLKENCKSETHTQKGENVLLLLEHWSLLRAAFLFQLSPFSLSPSPKESAKSPARVVGSLHLPAHSFPLSSSSSVIEASSARPPTSSSPRFLSPLLPQLEALSRLARPQLPSPSSLPLSCWFFTALQISS